LELKSEVHRARIWQDKNKNNITMNFSEFKKLSISDVVNSIFHDQCQRSVREDEQMMNFTVVKRNETPFPKATLAFALLSQSYISSRRSIYVSNLSQMYLVYRQQQSSR
jgi:hypothetical protein